MDEDRIKTITQALIGDRTDLYHHNATHRLTIDTLAVTLTHITQALEHEAERQTADDIDMLRVRFGLPVFPPPRL